MPPTNLAGGRHQKLAEGGVPVFSVGTDAKSVVAESPRISSESIL